MEHPGAALPGWSLGYTQERGFPYARLETELGRFTAVWYDGVENAASVVFNAVIPVLDFQHAPHRPSEAGRVVPRGRDSRPVPAF